MQRLLLLFVAFLLPAAAGAQDWTFDNAFPSDDAFRQGGTDTEFEISSSNGNYDGHGIAVDPDGKVWFQYFHPTDSVQVAEFTANDPAGRDGYRDVRVIYVFNADGSEADISPVKFASYPGGDADTLGGFLRRANADGSGDLVWEGNSNRGLRADPRGVSLGGNVLVSVFDFLYVIDYQTGAGVAGARFPEYCASTQATSDDNDVIYVAPVCPGQAIRSLTIDGQNYTAGGNVVDASSDFSRGVQVARDGLTFYESAYENTYTIVHTRDDRFSSFDSTGVTFRGMRTESMAIHPVTNNVWASAGNLLNLPNQDATVTTNWSPQTWYAFSQLDAVANEVPTPVDSIKWNNPVNTANDNSPRPRGLAFNAAGTSAYVAQFGSFQNDVAAQKFSTTASQVAVEPGAAAGIASLQPNAPNPASGTTEIRFTLTEATQARVRLYDMSGREVMTVLNETLAAGEYARTVTVRDLPAGTYVYTLEAEGQTTSRRMLVVR